MVKSPLTKRIIYLEVSLLVQNRLQSQGGTRRFWSASRYNPSTIWAMRIKCDYQFKFRSRFCMRQHNQVLNVSESPLFYRAFMSIPTLFIIFPDFFFSSLVFGFTAYLALLFSLSLSSVSQENLRCSCSLNVNSS